MQVLFNPWSQVCGCSWISGMKILPSSHQNNYKAQNQRSPNSHSSLEAEASNVSYAGLNSQTQTRVTQMFKQQLLFRDQFQTEITPMEVQAIVQRDKPVSILKISLKREKKVKNSTLQYPSTLEDTKLTDFSTVQRIIDNSLTIKQLQNIEESKNLENGNLRSSYQPLSCNKQEQKSTSIEKRKHSRTKTPQFLQLQPFHGLLQQTNAGMHEIISIDDAISAEVSEVIDRGVQCLFKLHNCNCVSGLNHPTKFRSTLKNQRNINALNQKCQQLHPKSHFHSLKNLHSSPHSPQRQYWLKKNCRYLKDMEFVRNPAIINYQTNNNYFVHEENNLITFRKNSSTYSLLT